MKTYQDPDPCDYCGQRPAAFPVAGVVLCRDCYARVVKNGNQNAMESDEQKPQDDM